jgi:hypothetical protein
MLDDVAFVLGLALIGCGINALLKVLAAHSTNRAFQSFAALT